MFSDRQIRISETWVRTHLPLAFRRAGIGEVQAFQADRMSLPAVGLDSEVVPECQSGEQCGNSVLRSFIVF